MSFSRGDVRVLREELQAVIDKYAADHGLIVKFGNATYSDSEITFKVNVLRADVDNAKAKWDECCAAFGLAQEDFGKEILLSGKKFVVSGIRPSARKNCILIRNLEDGKEYVISRETFISVGGIDRFAAWRTARCKGRLI